jgi:hypothetical protein
MKHYHLILTGLFACVFYHVQAQEHRLLRDPYVYETAAGMYAVADILPFDGTAALLVADISRQLEQGFMPEDEIIWATLQELEPYRKSRQVQKALKTWTEHIREAERSDSTSATSSDSRLISPVAQAYRWGEFDEVITLSRKLLHNPGPKIRGELLQVVRNNLALALMHENRDLCAQMELELLNTETEIRYFPALINLTVVYERLGKRKEAEVLADRLTEYMKKEKLEMPLADFNAIWLQGEKEDHRSVAKAMEMVSSTKLIKKQGAPKYADYKKLLAAKYKSFSILKIGFIGKGFGGSGGWRIIGFLIFIVYWVVAVRLGTGLFKCFDEIFELFPTLLILLYFASAFILAYGIPSAAAGWIGLVGFEVSSYIFVLAKRAE